MKLVFAIIILSVNFVFASSSYAQKTALSINIRNKAIADILDEIEKQSEFRFYYNSKIVDTNRKITIQAQNEDVFTILDEIFKSSNIGYKVVDRDIILTERNTGKSITLPGLTLQGITVKGTITDEVGDPLPGVNIIIKGTTTGTVTDLDGLFSITVPGSSSVLTISFLGYIAQEITVGNQQEFRIIMKDDIKQLEEVVVTALGIEKRSKGLAYTTQKVSSDELTTIKDPSMINSLAGKVSGVTITKSSSLGGASKVSLRGNRSLQGSNQPLYVVDGIPISNTVGPQADAQYNANRDGGDGISNLNPDDIESMSVLKGAAAAVLYGSQAANGVIVITTKKGKAGTTRIDFSSNYTADLPIHLLEFQDKYGRTSSNATDSWGAAQSMDDTHVKDFFSVGHTFINSLSMSGGNDIAQVFFSYSNTSGRGNIDNNKLNRNTFNIRGTAKFLNDKLTIDGRLNYMEQNVKNRPQTSLYMNTLPGLYLYPRGAWKSGFEDQYEIYDPERNVMRQNWDESMLSDESRQNPYWVKNRITSKDKRDRYIGSLSAKYDITSFLNIQGRVSMDRIVDNYQRQIYATTTPTWAPGGNGRYTYYDGIENQTYGDIMANFNKQFEDISVVAMVGASITDYKINKLNMDSDKNGLYYPNFFNVTNVKNGGSIRDRSDQHRQLQSVFGTAQFGFKDLLFLDLTGRNDWSSTVNDSYFYPSVGLTAILSDMISFPAVFDYAKIRGSWSQVGSDLPIYITNPMRTMNPSGDLIPNEKAPFTGMKPEISNSLEAGFEFSMFKNALNMDFTIYKTNTRNQYFELPAPVASGYSTYYINAGNIQNVGIEVMLSANPFWRGDFKWKTIFNFSTNKNKVISLTDQVQKFTLTTSDALYIYAIEGDEWGDIYAKTLQKDPNGHLIVTAEGVPLTNNDQTKYEKVGNINPDFMLGWNNILSYKAFSLGFLIDCRVGGSLISYTQAIMDQAGVSKTSGEMRDNPITDAVLENGTAYGKPVDAKTYYATVGGRSGAAGEYIYSATNVRMREISLTYRFPTSFTGNDKFIKDLRLSLVGRNLFFFYIDAPFDPDYTMNSGNTFQNTDVFGMPTTRSFGITLNASF